MALPCESLEYWNEADSLSHASGLLVQFALGGGKWVEWSFAESQGRVWNQAAERLH